MWMHAVAHVHVCRCTSRCPCLCVCVCVCVCVRARAHACMCVHAHKQYSLFQYTYMLSLHWHSHSEIHLSLIGFPHACLYFPLVWTAGMLAPRTPSPSVCGTTRKSTRSRGQGFWAVCVSCPTLSSSSKTLDVSLELHALHFLSMDILLDFFFFLVHVSDIRINVISRVCVADLQASLPAICLSIINQNGKKCTVENCLCILYPDSFVPYICWRHVL